MIEQCKQCKQCGSILPLSSFRKYYGGRDGTYTKCKTCEKINSREKYLRKKGSACKNYELDELEKIHSLYALQESRGFSPPRVTKQERTVDTVSAILSSYGGSTIPEDLQKWLTCELTLAPEYYIDTVYDSLLRQYAPLKKIDETTYARVHDQTYKAVLDKILDRFYDYEDSYYNQEDK